jgi:hypothetical protein
LIADWSLAIVSAAVGASIDPSESPDSTLARLEVIEPRSKEEGTLPALNEGRPVPVDTVGVVGPTFTFAPGCAEGLVTAVISLADCPLDPSAAAAAYAGDTGPDGVE